LIVDDDNHDSILAKNSLNFFGVMADVAENGDAAVKRIKENNYAVIFLDWRLIGKSGRVTLMEIKSIAPKCVVIVLTGAAYSEDVSEALKLGAAAVMLKPLTEENVKLIFGSPTNPSNE